MTEARHWNSTAPTGCPVRLPAGAVARREPRKPARERIGRFVRAGTKALAALTALALTAPAAAAGEPDAGRAKARMCQTCHGLDGIGRMPDVPNIGGESALYITRQLNAFRSGERRHEQMSIIAAGLGDDDIADLAAWYSSIEFSVRVPE